MQEEDESAEPFSWDDPLQRAMMEEVVLPTMREWRGKTATVNELEAVPPNFYFQGVYRGTHKVYICDTHVGIQPTAYTANPRMEPPFVIGKFEDPEPRPYGLPFAFTESKRTHFPDGTILEQKECANKWLRYLQDERDYLPRMAFLVALKYLAPRDYQRDKVIRVVQTNLKFLRRVAKDLGLPVEAIHMKANVITPSDANGNVSTQPSPVVPLFVVPYMFYRDPRARHVNPTFISDLARYCDSLAAWISCWDNNRGSVCKGRLAFTETQRNGVAFQVTLLRLSIKDVERLMGIDLATMAVDQYHLNARLTESCMKQARLEIVVGRVLEALDSAGLSMDDVCAGMIDIEALPLPQKRKDRDWDLHKEPPAPKPPAPWEEAGAAPCPDMSAL